MEEVDVNAVYTNPTVTKNEKMTVDARRYCYV